MSTNFLNISLSSLLGNIGVYNQGNLRTLQTDARDGDYTKLNNDSLSFSGTAKNSGQKQEYIDIATLASAIASGKSSISSAVEPFSSIDETDAHNLSNLYSIEHEDELEHEEFGSSDEGPNLGNLEGPNPAEA